jgi:hypothetical protein
MPRDFIKIQFLDDVPPDEIEAALIVAVFATESLYGAPRLRLDGGHNFDRDRLVLTVDATAAVGQSLSRLFVGFISRELDEECYSVRHLSSASALEVK